jgi:hypothetical protein
MDSCKECDFVNLTITTQNTSAGYPIGIVLNETNSNLKTFVPVEAISLTTGIHNLNYSLKASESFSSSVKPIVLTFNRTNYNLTVE